MRLLWRCTRVCFADQAHAPLAIERDTLAKPNAGKVLRRFFGERLDMALSS